MPGAHLIVLTLATALTATQPVGPAPASGRAGAPPARVVSAPPPPPSTPIPGGGAPLGGTTAPTTSPSPDGAPPVAAPSAAAPPLAYPVATAPAAPAVPAGLEVEAARYQRLQTATGLDLHNVWTDYARDPRGQRFYDYTRARYRRRLGTGIALSIAGLGLAGAGMALVLVAAAKDTDEAEIDIIGGALVMTAGLCLLAPGAILWPTSQVRLHKLQQAEHAVAARPGLRALGPLVLPRGAGLGLRLAF